MNTIPLLWALWLIGGGHAHSGYLSTEPKPVAYFQTQQECESVQAILGRARTPYGTAAVKWSQCIQAGYAKP